MEARREDFQSLPAEYNTVTADQTLHVQYSTVANDQCVPVQYSTVTADQTLHVQYSNVAVDQSLPLQYSNVADGKTIHVHYSNVAFLVCICSVHYCRRWPDSTCTVQCC